MRAAGHTSSASPVVDELQIQVEIGRLEQALDLLQIVATLRLHAQLIALDLGLHALRTFVADDLADLLRILRRDAVLDARDDAVLLTARERLTRIEALQRDAALD